MTRRQAAGWLALALLSTSGGCDPHAGAPPISGSLEEATVKGTVRLRGKPVSDGMITFRTANINRPMTPTYQAPIGKDGTYTIKTLVGENFVNVAFKELYTPRYREFMDNEQMIRIKSGENILDIDIPREALRNQNPRSAVFDRAREEHLLITKGEDRSLS